MFHRAAPHRQGAPAQCSTGPLGKAQAHTGQVRDPDRTLQSQFVQADVEREPRDRGGQQAVGRRDQLEQFLVAFCPGQSHLLAERRGKEPRGQEPVQRP